MSHLTDEQLSDYIDDAGDSQTLAHLGSCAMCQSRASEMSVARNVSVSGSLNDARREEIIQAAHQSFQAAKGAERRPARNGYKYAGMAAVIALLVAVPLNLRETNSPATKESDQNTVTGLANDSAKSAPQSAPTFSSIDEVKAAFLSTTYSQNIASDDAAAESTASECYSAASAAATVKNLRITQTLEIQWKTASEIEGAVAYAFGRPSSSTIALVNIYSKLDCQLAASLSY